MEKESVPSPVRPYPTKEGTKQMTAAERDQRISEVFDAMEAGEATTDDWWDAIFPSLQWCEYELKQLGFHLRRM